MKEKWMITNKRESFLKLSSSVKANPLILRLLANRGIDNQDDVENFLNGTIKDFHNPKMLEDMIKGIDIIEHAINENKKIIIYGDYDCDGVISTVIFHKALTRLGANFNYHIPDRECEGYGMNVDRIRKLKDEKYDVILTCDNGISAFDEVKLAKELGMKVIITDHHDVPIKEVDSKITTMLPEADAIINPKRKECKYPFKSLCGAGVALKFVQCLFERFDVSETEWIKLIEFVAIATVCDVVDLLDENRIIVNLGLELLNSTNNIGLKELARVTGLSDKTIGEYHLGFVIGPCINATGRLETANISVELLITESEVRAKELAIKLFELNTIRQELTKESAERIVGKVEKNKKNSDRVIVVYDEYIHESIAGIVAGRVKERFNLPTIVLSKGKDMPKGSARSIEKYNIFEELSKCKYLLSKFGGHPMAAGLSIPEENIVELRNILNNNCDLTLEDILPIIKIDCQLELKYLTEDLVNIIEGLRPFGKGNPSPLFAVKRVHAERIWLMGKDKNILKLRLKSNNRQGYIDAISFDKCDEFRGLFIEKYGESNYKIACDSSYIDADLDIVYYPNINDFNGKKSIQLIVKNIRIS